MDPPHLVPTIQDSRGGVTLGGMFSRHTFSLLIPFNQLLECHRLSDYCSWPCAYFMATIYPSPNGHFQNNNAPWVHEHDNEPMFFSDLPSHLDLNPLFSFGMVRINHKKMHLNNELQDAIMSAWSRVYLKELLWSLQYRIRGCSESRGRTVQSARGVYGILILNELPLQK